jgi:hypothetical protein
MLALLICFVLVATVGADEEKQPKIVIEEMRHDFGETYEQKVYKHTFKVKNTGDAELFIKQVKPG